MKALSIGERVRIISSIPAFWDHIGRVVQIIEPFVLSQLKDMALQELPLYAVRLEDGRSFRFRGRDLERMNPKAF
jgi:hypothetical protein